MNSCCSIAMLVSLVACGDAHESAISELKKSGAIVSYNTDKEEWSVFIDSKWKGGDEGIDQLERLKQLSSLSIKGRPKISEERLAKLKKTLPDLKIMRRGNAYLGISWRANEEDGCAIAYVSPASPAEKAGLVPGDVIEKVEGKKIEEFEELLNVMLTKEPGDEISLGIIRRNGESITVAVKLVKYPY